MAKKQKVSFEVDMSLWRYLKTVAKAADCSVQTVIAVFIAAEVTRLTAKAAREGKDVR